MQTAQQKKQREVDNQLAHVINRRLIEKEVKLSDYITEDTLDKLKKFLLHPFAKITAIQYQIGNSDYLDLFNKIYSKVSYQELSINVYELGTICKMLSTGADVDINTEEDVFEFLMFKVETEPLNILFEKQLAEIENYAEREVLSNLKVAKQESEK